MTQRRGGLFYFTGAVVVLVLITAASAWWWLGSSECDGYCLSDEDRAFVDRLETDSFLSIVPPGASPARPSLTKNCYASGGWFGVIERRTSAPMGAFVSFYADSARQHGWAEVRRQDGSSDPFITFRRGEGPDAVTVVLRPLVSADPSAAGGMLVVQSPRLTESCSTWRD